MEFSFQKSLKIPRHFFKYAKSSKNIQFKRHRKIYQAGLFSEDLEWLQVPVRMEIVSDRSITEIFFFFYISLNMLLDGKFNIFFRNYYPPITLVFSFTFYPRPNWISLRLVMGVLLFLPLLLMELRLEKGNPREFNAKVDIFFGKQKIAGKVAKYPMMNFSLPKGKTRRNGAIFGSNTWHISENTQTCL